MPPKPFSNIFNIQCLSLAVGMLMTLVVNTLGATAPHPLVLGVLGALGLAMMVMSHLVAKSLSNPSLVVSMYFPFGLLYLISHSATASHPRTAEIRFRNCWMGKLVRRWKWHRFWWWWLYWLDTWTCAFFTKEPPKGELCLCQKGWFYEKD